MILPINNKYRIKGDCNAYAIQMFKYIDKEGKQIWESFLWYTSLESAINGYIDYKFRTSDIDSTDSALTEIQNIADELEAIKAVKLPICMPIRHTEAESTTISEKQG